MRLLVCGSREWSNAKMMTLVLDGFYAYYGDDLQIVEGCAAGADRLAEEWARHKGLEPHHFPARWDEYPSHLRWRAGHDRNKAMLDHLLAYHGHRAVVAFKDGFRAIAGRGGTENMVDIAIEADIPTMVVGSGRKPEQGRLVG